MSTALLGVMFLVVGFAAMFLMFHLWGYPFDKVAHKSSAPQWAMYFHRALGYLFVLIYVVLMWHMVPRLWQYQVEFPARTTAHIILGFTIGFLLLVKISIMRFFRHFEEWMPVLGTSIMLGTVLLLGLSLPFVFQERALQQAAPGGDATSPQSLARVKELLPQAGLPEGSNIAALASAESITEGRDVLLDKCVRCHDLKTILAKPRTPADWWSVVERMAEKPALFAPLTAVDQLHVTAYLVAITPDLQKSTKKKRAEVAARSEAVSQANADAGGSAAAPPPPLDAAQLVTAKATFEKVCSQCHDASDTDGKPPKGADDAKALVERMITANDAKISADEIKVIVAYLTATYVDRKKP